MRVAATMPVIAFAATLLGAGSPAGPPDYLPGPVRAEVVRVIDGDTLVVRARIWLFQDLETRVRLAGADAPEINGACESERRLALDARAAVERLADGRVVELRDIHYGKYAGRVVARVFDAGGRDLARALIETGLARPYGGDARRSWCEAATAPEAAPKPVAPAP